MKVAGIGRDGRKWGCENYESSLLIPVFCCMAFAVEYCHTASKIQHPTGCRGMLNFTGKGEVCCKMQILES